MAVEVKQNKMLKDMRAKQFRKRHFISAQVDINQLLLLPYYHEYKKKVFYKHNLLNFTVTHICEHKPTQTEMYDPKISNPSQNLILCTYMHKKYILNTTRSDLSDDS